VLGLGFAEAVCLALPLPLPTSSGFEDLHNLRLSPKHQHSKQKSGKSVHLTLWKNLSDSSPSQIFLGRACRRSTSTHTLAMLGRVRLVVASLTLRGFPTADGIKYKAYFEGIPYRDN
jgi:hypothetical protein